MHQNNFGRQTYLAAIVLGAICALIVSLSIAALGALLVQRAILGTGVLGAFAWIGTVVAAACGAGLAGALAGRLRLPVCCGCGTLYLLLGFLLRGLLFGTITAHLWRIPLCVILGTVIGTLFSAGRGR